MRGFVPLLALASLHCAGQDLELGVGGGYGFYRSVSVYAPGGTVDAGVRNRFVVAAWLTHHMYEPVSGQLRYIYQDGDPFLQKGHQQVNVQGKSNAIHYDVLVHLSSRGAKVRPYFSAGVGVKRYTVTGPANPDQPFLPMAQLTATSENKFLFVAGGGVSVKLRPGLALLFDFRDYVTTFPKQIIRPAPLATARGLFNQFTPACGIAVTF